MTRRQTDCAGANTPLPARRPRAANEGAAARRTARRVSAAACCAGYGMMELLVALALAGAGLFGFVQMQYQALLVEREQTARLHGLMLFDEIAAHLRAAGAATGSVGDYAAGLEDTAKDAPDCRAAACTAKAFARFQVAQWKCRAAGAACGNPGARLSSKLMIKINDGAFTLRLQWKTAAGDERAIERNGTWRIITPAPVQN